VKAAVLGPLASLTGADAVGADVGGFVGGEGHRHGVVDASFSDFGVFVEVEVAALARPLPS